MPDTCDKAKTEPLSSAGGTLTLPPCAGFRGTMGYASNNAQNATISFTDTQKNVFGAPNPPGATPIFYTRLRATGPKDGIQFNFGNQTATLSSASLVASQTYAFCIYIGTFALQRSPTSMGSPSGSPPSLKYPSLLTKQGLSATGGVLGTKINFDLVVTEGVPTKC